MFWPKIGESTSGITKMTFLLIVTHMKTCIEIQKMKNLWLFSG